MSGHRLWLLERRALVTLLALGLLANGIAPALAHSGGLDAKGGHYCREAGFKSGKCSPLNSYHYHGGGGGTSGGSSSGGTSSGTSSSGSTSSGGSSSSPSGTSAPVAPLDTTPPDRPRVGRATVDGGTVVVPVTAERGSTLRFIVAGVTVHTVTASGSEEDVAFRLADGRHTVSVTATDAAGNASPPADFTVSLDTTAPEAPQLSADLGGSAGAETSLRIEGERGSTYALELEGPSAESESGRLSSGMQSFAWLLPNGEYTVTATLIDNNGNKSSVSRTTFVVELPAPDMPSLTVISDTGADPIVVKVVAPGATVTLVTLRDEGGSSTEKRIDLDTRNQGTVELSGTDGVYSLEAVALDFQGQQSAAAHLEGIHIKTSPPSLTLGFVDDLLRTGLFAYELQAEEGATVRILSETAELLAEFTATGLSQEFSFEVPSGDHIILVSVTDGFGNETVEEFIAAVSAPLGLFGWFAVFFSLALLAAASLGIGKLWQRFRGRSTAAGKPTMPPPPALQP